jgi:hypothetical protein
VIAIVLKFNARIFERANDWGFYCANWDGVPNLKPFERRKRDVSRRC